MSDHAAVAATPGETSLGRVMLIDDESFDLKMYRRIISRSGIEAEVLAFTSAEDALDYLLDPDSPQVALIFLDVNMPRMTGFEFIEAVSSSYGQDFNIPVVLMLTTSLSPTDRARAENLSPIRAFFNKPLTQDHLSNAAAILAESRA